MPARTKKPAPAVAVADNAPSASDSASEIEDEADAVSSSSEAGSSQDQDGSDNESGRQSDSDSLDNAEPRKRRRISPGTEGAFVDEDDDDDDDQEKKNEDNGTKASKKNGTPMASFISAPSRIKKKNPSSQQPTITTATTTATSLADDALPDPAATTAPTDPNTTFESLGVHPWLVRSLTNMAIRRPTGIQKGCIPEILKGRDCIGGSRTGSGKTVAFAVPILQKWAEDPSAIFAVVLTPTRELALQMYEQFKAISSPQTLKAVLITGGADMRAQAIALAERPHIVIATPGRLADHIRTSGEDTICGLRRVKFVVFDEADRLLASGPGSMLPDISECLDVLPDSNHRQTLLFTATVTPEVRLAKDKPRTPPVFLCEVDTQTMAIPPSLHQSYIQVPVTHREHYLHIFLQTPANADKSIIIFCNRTATATYLHHLLHLLDHKVTALHSQLPQRQRVDNLSRFRAGPTAARILVATDVAARGLDIPEVSTVLNYDIPRDPDVYIHRVGRTARAGRKGDAVTFVGQRDVELVQAIEARVGRQMLKWDEEGVNLETRVVRDALRVVGEKSREALLDIEERREVGSKRKRGKVKFRAAA
ncbi:P-loop containing nucleoside triphosphate hydrolase protein [Coniella lustricola]|uniref:P-loop containing nucleoside triphosphate hydrolase protein n=1 Tax=Coniella lustricola TaxID=2025994 RepID=A0A2T3AF84_9PEZI|nr:P-loop containing nucleoside triphosphate hydrolase protein [Coniella lustricola]